VVLTLVMALIACGIAGYHIAHRGLRPVAAITDAARRIRSTTLHEHIQISGLPGELAGLAGQFNEMLDRLQESFDRLSRFSADIAHELRTPVNNIRGEAEVALGMPRSPGEYREVLSSCLEECGRLSHLIDCLLFLARAESPQTQIVKEKIEVAKELSNVRDFYEGAAAEAQVNLVVKPSEGIVAELDRTLFQRAVGNLLANALAHTPPDGIVTLSALHTGTSVQVQVSDTGVGIDAGHLPHVFDRFYRADLARSNASGRVGLGLAIVKAIVALHGGSVKIASEMDHGTSVTLVFPCCQ
jgi:two-component system heavy metal sensor histidine kinase CusS